MTQKRAARRRGRGSGTQSVDQRLVNLGERLHELETRLGQNERAQVATEKAHEQLRRRNHLMETELAMVDCGPSGGGVRAARLCELERRVSALRTATTRPWYARLWTSITRASAAGA